MTENEHAEVSRQLALAIGWKPDDVQLVMEFQGQVAYCEVWPLGGASGGKWRKFDYRAKDVIDPIQRHFAIVGHIITDGAKKGKFFAHEIWGHSSATDDTAALAVARAVIAAKESTK